MAEQNGEFREWAILELMGHRQLVGQVSEELIAGALFLRVDIPKGDGPLFDADMTQYYHPQAVYCLTPTTEEVVRQFAKNRQMRPPTLSIPYQPDEEEF